MSILLGVISGLVALVTGGGAIYLLFLQATDSGAAVLALFPGVIAVLNVLVLRALLGRRQPQRWAFYLLAALDVAAALLMGMFWSAISFQVGDIWTIAAPAMAVLLLKAVLTVLVARKLPRGGVPTQG